jgi:hypothetical protein
MPVYRVRAELTLTGMPDKAVNVFHLKTASALTTGGLDDAIVKIKAFYTAIKANYSTACSIRIGDAVERVDVTPATGLGATPATEAGSTSGNSFAANACMIVTWRTGLPGRAKRGRIYLGPFVDLRQDTATTWSASNVTAVQNAATTLISDLASLSVPKPLTVFHRATLTDDLVTSALARNVMGTQKRRLR